MQLIFVYTVVNLDGLSYFLYKNEAINGFSFSLAVTYNLNKSQSVFLGLIIDGMLTQPHGRTSMLMMVMNYIVIRSRLDLRFQILHIAR